MQLSLFDIPKEKKQEIEHEESCCIELSEIFEAYFSCRFNKRNTANAIAFEVDYENNLVKLHEEINNGTYQPGRSIALQLC